MLTQVQISTEVRNRQTGQSVGRICDMPSDLIRVKLATYKLTDSLRADYETELACRVARADNELLEDIVDALIEQGFAKHVAQALCDTEAKMLAQGKRLGII